MSLLRGTAAHWVRYRLGLQPAYTQVTPAERDCLRRHATGRRSLVEIGVMYGANTALLRSVMDPQGTVWGIDPHPPGRLGVSFEQLVARRELAKYQRGTAILLRQFSYDAAVGWSVPVDFLFIDGDHSWTGIARDWCDWSSHVVTGGIVALHDSRSVLDRPDHDSVRYAAEVILPDRRFRAIDGVDSLTVLERAG